MNKFVKISEYMVNRKINHISTWKQHTIETEINKMYYLQ